MEVLAYISCIDKAYARENLTPKIAENKELWFSEWNKETLTNWRIIEQSRTRKPISVTSERTVKPTNINQPYNWLAP